MWMTYHLPRYESLIKKNKVTSKRTYTMLQYGKSVGYLGRDRIMSSDDWLIVPGQKHTLSSRIQDLVNTYLERTGLERSLCINDDDEFIYFIFFPTDDSPMQSADVAVLYQDEYIFLPKDMALQMAESYVIHVKLMSEAFDWLHDGGKSNV